MPSCGPIQTVPLMMDANKALEEAKAFRADSKAPYEYTAAKAYYHKAKEELGYSNYEASVEFGKRALILARKAIGIARTAPKEPK